MRVEVVALDAFGIRQDDLSHAERRELCPQAPHHFRARQREQHIDLRAWGSGGLELAAKSDSAFAGRHHRARAEWTVEQTDSHRLSRCGSQHVHHVRGARVGERHAVRVDAVAFVEQHQVHVAILTNDGRR